MARRTFQSIAEYLKATERTQYDLAEELGVSEPTMSRIVRGTRLPSADLLIRLHEITGVPIENMVRANAEVA